MDSPTDYTSVENGQDSSQDRGRGVGNGIDDITTGGAGPLAADEASAGSMDDELAIDMADRANDMGSGDAGDLGDSDSGMDDLPSTTGATDPTATNSTDM